MLANASKRRTVAVLCVLVLTALGSAWAMGWLAQQHKLMGRLIDYKRVEGGLWEMACDTAVDGSDAGCYIQYVDVYRSRPDFAAAMVEIVYRDGADGEPDPHIRFDIEPGFRIRDAVMTLHGPDMDTGNGRSIDLSHCRRNTCVIAGQAGRALIADWRDADRLDFVIEEGRDIPARRSWQMVNFPDLLDDFAAQRAARDLP